MSKYFIELSFCYSHSLLLQILLYDTIRYDTIRYDTVEWQINVSSKADEVASLI